MTAQSSILRNIKVIDFGHYAAGPMAGMLLADQGADVIKIDPPGGPVFDTPANAMWNRGKRRIALDLHNEADRVIALDLMRDADVVIENFRPRTMAKWGLAETDIRDLNPGLIYVSMPGFSPEDPRSQFQAWEGTIFAAVDAFRTKIRYKDLGLQTTTPPSEREGAPMPLPDCLASAYGAVISCNSILAALMARKQSGLGQAIQVPLVEALLQGVGVGASTPFPAMKRELPTFTPLELQYECADGRHFHLICSIRAHAIKILRYLGKEDFIERGLDAEDITQRPDEYAELYAYMDEVFRTRTSLEWEQVFLELELPGSICRTLDEFLAHDMATKSDYLVAAQHDGKPMRQPNSPVVLNRSHAFEPASVSTPDADRAQILAELDAARAKPAGGNSELRLSRLGRKPLAGVKVVDLCVILAGPVSGRTLAEYGAEVIKIDDPVRGPNAFHDDVNRGKTSVFLNLREAEDLKSFWALVKDADVVVQNFRLKALDKYGITGEAVRAANPNAIWVSTNAYGDKGPWAHLPGYEGSVQAATGLQTRYGDISSPSSFPYAVHDYLTGYITGFGILLALYARETTGEVLDVQAGLARTASFLQSSVWMEKLAAEAGVTTADKADGFFQGIFSCTDGPVHIGIRQASRFREVFGLAAGDDLEAYLQGFCAARSKKQVEAELRVHDFAAHELAWIRDAMTDKALQARGVSEIRHNHSGIAKWQTAPARWMSLSPAGPASLAQKPGAGQPQFVS